MGENHLSAADYDRLAAVMAGPHGQPVSADNPVDFLVVFSCADPRVGQEAASLYGRGLVRHVVFSGAVGKDSGGLPRLGIPEAVFLASVAIADGLPVEAISLELEARNGKENAANSLRLLNDRRLLRSGTKVAGLAPAQRSRRLYEELRFQTQDGGYDATVVAGFASGRVHADDPQVRDELVREVRGLHTMHAGASPRILPQDDFQTGGQHYDLVELSGILGS
ncbi:YdcF family protein [Amycolatopsis sp. NPDC005003]